MEDEVKLLIEETGCSDDTAREVLSSSENNLNLAFQHIASRSRHFMVFKARMALPETHHSGLFLILVNIPQKKILRIDFTLVNHTSLYETDLSRPWHEVERLIYAERLSEGSSREISTRLEQDLLTSLKENRRFYLLSEKEEKEELSDLLKQLLCRSMAQEKVYIELELQKISMNELHQKEEKNSSHPGEKESHVHLHLKLRIPQGKIGEYRRVRAEKLREGDTIMVEIVDERDIAWHLSQFLGADQGDEKIPIPALLEKKNQSKSWWALRVRFNPNISGEGTVEAGSRVSVFIVDKRRKLFYFFLFLSILSAVLWTVFHL